jgi:hypothetical protein
LPFVVHAHTTPHPTETDRIPCGRLVRSSKQAGTRSHALLAAEATVLLLLLLLLLFLLLLLLLLLWPWLLLLLLLWPWLLSLLVALEKEDVDKGEAGGSVLVGVVAVMLLLVLLLLPRSLPPLFPLRF